METTKGQPKNKKLTICLSKEDFNLLETIRMNHKRSISQLIRDAIIFYGIYYAKPNQI